ncbi:ABC transporter-like, ATP-binding domain [Dillenia turbinata]|uniref:ABC transporter-like, ATP-binding domain n=1 Tax=Dillenia turbinata TaxID=194707 RepID=A0AAN8ZC79_9MAGN
MTGAVCAGQLLLLAILDPSDTGKTTLLTALEGRVSGHVEGIISYNGDNFSNSMRRRTGFVTQDSSMYPHLTVIESLVTLPFFACQTALPSKRKLSKLCWFPPGVTVLKHPPEEMNNLLSDDMLGLGTRRVTVLPGSGAMSRLRAPICESDV